MRSVLRIVPALMLISAIGALGFVSLHLAYLAAMLGLGICLGIFAGRDA